MIAIYPHHIMQHIIILIFVLLPLWAYSQSETDIRIAIKNCNYEIPIQQIPTAAGDSILTPMRAQALKAMNRHPDKLILLPVKPIKQWIRLRVLLCTI